MTLPLFHQQYNSTVTYTILPDYNELGEPMDGTLVDLAWSPGGRYLTISHVAVNKFSIISLADCGDPLAGHVEMGRIAQATPSRFNSMSPYWGNKRVDAELAKYEILISQATGHPLPEDVSTTLYFLTDRDVRNDASSPWGSRAPFPHFPRHTLLYALPFTALGDNGDLDSNLPLGPFSGGAAMEIFAADIDALTLRIKGLMTNRLSGSSVESSDGSARRLAIASRQLAHEAKRRGLATDSPAFQRVLKNVGPEMPQATEPPTEAPTTAEPPPEEPPPNHFPVDMEIDFGPMDLSFARRAFRMAHVPESNYYDILAQTADDGSLLLVDVTSTYVASIKIFAADHYPYDGFKDIPLSTPGARLVAWGTSTDREFIYIVLAPGNIVKVFKNALSDVAGFMSEMAAGTPTTHIADVGGMALSVWPRLEYRQLFNDAWRLLRDYFYDTEMHQLDWPAIHERYVSLVGRCNKREELDDVLAQMAAELSALHVFVYGGEYASPLPDESVLALHLHASLGATLRRVAEWKGYVISEIPERDPDFNLVSGSPVYSPLSSQSLWQSGQKGLAVGDVIVGVNGESVFRVPDIHMLLRGLAGRSVRLEVLRLESGGDNANADEAIPEPVIVVPITLGAAANLRYNAWEYKSRQLAKTLAGEAGFSVGYIHMRAMGSADINAFAQGFFEDYNKETLILDVRHNHGGNIDSWVSTMLQRAAWSYFGGRNTRFGGGDMDWDQQFAFRGHVVVLIDEHTSSDGEGVSRSISELGIGRLVGTRTWGGGIWLASDNKLVDGGIATAPEFAVYNDKFGWGMGIGT
jgi:C-terminal processing protease CtpA/Prc